MAEIIVFWFRRDLRLHDNTGLSHALQCGKHVLPIFIFDTDILDPLEDRADRRVSMIYDMVLSLKAELEALGSSLLIEHGRPIDVFQSLAQRYRIDGVFTNHDYEPYGMKRDASISDWCGKNRVVFRSFKDIVVFEKNEVLKGDGKPYTVFTPYSRKWMSLCNEHCLKSCDTDRYNKLYFKTEYFPTPSLGELGFSRFTYHLPSKMVDDDLILHYKTNRDYPSIAGTSKLSTHLRFGTISIRELVSRAIELDFTFLTELIWREFYMMILSHFPQVVTRSFKPQYDNIKWINDEKQFECWCKGKTGYPIVDAGMRELNETGFMHNRVRMIVANLLISV